KIVQVYEHTAERLRRSPYAQQRDKTWTRAAADQWMLAGELAELARMVRPAPERLALLREVDRQLQQRLDEQSALIADTRTPPAIEGGDVQKEEADPRVEDDRGFPGRRGRCAFGRRREEVATPADPRVGHGRQMGDRQGWQEHETRVIRGQLAAPLPGLAARLVGVEARMRDAQEELRRQM